MPSLQVSDRYALFGGGMVYVLVPSGNLWFSMTCQGSAEVFKQYGTMVRAIATMVMEQW